MFESKTVLRSGAFAVMRYFIKKLKENIDSGGIKDAQTTIRTGL